MTLDLPPDAGQKREDAILDYIQRGHFEVRWTTVTATHNGRTAEISVFADALKIDGVRINVTAFTAQRIADLLGCLLLTPKLADLSWLQREITLPPFPRPITATTAAMIEHSEKIDEELKKFPSPTGGVGTVGKHWTIDDALLLHPGMAENYGWHYEGEKFQGISGAMCASKARSPNGQIVRVIQGTGWRHDPNHSDYSQICMLAAGTWKIDGVDDDARRVLQDVNLAPLASHTGAMKVLRQPGVPELTSTSVVIPRIVITGD